MKKKAKHSFCYWLGCFFQDNIVEVGLEEGFITLLPRVLVLAYLASFKIQNPGVGGKVPPPDPTPLLKKKTTFSRVAERFFNQKILKKYEKY